MPYPSSGCQTCRKRRIKCDETRPTCGQCIKSARECTGFKDEPGDLPWRSENVFASGMARRPRARAARQSPLSNTLSDLNVPSQKPKTGFPGARLKGQEDEPKIQQNPDISLEERALSYYNQNYIEIPEDISEDHLGRLIKGLLLGDTSSACRKALELTLSANALLIFARTHGAPRAQHMSSGKYAHALTQTKVALADDFQATTDELMISIMMMSSYEDLSCNFDANNLFSQAWRHHDGALALLKLRRRTKVRSSTAADLIDRHVRHRVIRNAVYRRLDVPEWLHDGASFGEHDIEAQLDLYMIQVARLRRELEDLRQRMKKRDGRNETKPAIDLKALLASGLLLDEHLSDWVTNLPSVLRYNVKRIPDNVLLGTYGNLDSMFYDSIVHLYPSARSATLWNRYGATRLIANNIIAGTLAGLAASPNPSMSPASEKRLRRAASTIAELVDDLCHGLPFHFSLVNQCNMEASGSVKVPKEFWDGSHPKIAVVSALRLSWPLVIASATSRIEDQQRDWVRAKLRHISEITGNGVLDCLSKMDLHKKVLCGTLAKSASEGSDIEPNRSPIARG